MAMQISPALHCIDMAKQPADTVFYSLEGPLCSGSGSSSEHKRIKTWLDKSGTTLSDNISS